MPPLYLGKRPLGGVKFSKSVACLNPNLSTGFTGDESASSTSGIETTSQVASKFSKFSDFTVISNLGQGSFGRVYHVIPKISGSSQITT